LDNCRQYHSSAIFLSCVYAHVLVYMHMYASMLHIHVALDVVYRIGCSCALDLGLIRFYNNNNNYENNNNKKITNDRNYTQNIDTLERVAGLERVIECHGSFTTATCLSCRLSVDADNIRQHIMTQVLHCCCLIVVEPFIEQMCRLR
jgi:hypothetical protein